MCVPAGAVAEPFDASTVVWAVMSHTDTELTMQCALPATHPMSFMQRTFMPVASDDGGVALRVSTQVGGWLAGWLAGCGVGFVLCRVALSSLLFSSLLFSSLLFSCACCAVALFGCVLEFCRCVRCFLSFFFGVGS